MSDQDWGFKRFAAPSDTGELRKAAIRVENAIMACLGETDAARPDYPELYAAREALRDAVAFSRSALENTVCPYVRQSAEGTAYCTLAEGSAPESGRAVALEEIAAKDGLCIYGTGELVDLYPDRVERNEYGEWFRKGSAAAFAECAAIAKRALSGSPSETEGREEK